jgi:hypothetical protein
MIDQPTIRPICQVEWCDSPSRWGTTKYGDKFPQRWCSAHHLKVNREHGADRREGKRRLTAFGYAFVWIKGKWRPEHRVIMEEKLGRAMLPGESVHHINGIRDDNRPENLELWVGGVRYGQRARDLRCPCCGCSYEDAVRPVDAPTKRWTGYPRSERSIRAAGRSCGRS